MSKSTEQPQPAPESSGSLPDATARNLSLSKAELEEAVRQVLPAILADESVEQILVQHSEFHTGPLPSPRSLAEYERVLPGVGAEFLQEWKNETSHRRKLQRDFAEDNSRRATRAQHYALMFGIAALVASVALAYLGATTAAAIIGSTTVLGVVGAFLSVKLLKERRETPKAPDANPDAA